MAAQDKKNFAAVYDSLGGADEPFTTAGPAAVTLDFTIKKFALQNLLEKAIHVVSSRDVMPVLKNFQFHLTPGRMRVVASDLERSMIVTTQLVTVAVPGVAVFPAHKMLHIVKEAKDSDVHTEVRKLNAQIDIGPTTWNQKLQGGYDFPVMPSFDDAVFTEVDRAKFAQALYAVRYAACKDAERASLMMIDVKAGRMTACDGARIQQASFGDIPFDFELPIGAVDDLLKLLKVIDLPTIRIGDAGSKLVFRLGDDIFMVNKLVAQFPDMERQLLRPALENTHELTVDREELSRAVRRVRINADQETSAIALRIAPGRVTVAARDKFGNEAQESIDAGWAGATRTVVVNHAFLTDMLAGHDRKECQFFLGDDTKSKKTPMLLKDPQAGTVGAVQQMLGDWVGA